MFHRSESRDEKGAVLVLTSISLMALLAFTAFAVDIGLRNQYIARDQHAIDAATLAAAYELQAGGGDLDNASATVKEILSQNLGLTVVDWTDCDNDQAMSDIAPTDVAINNTCISFGTNAAGEAISRVKLPDHNIDTIFGGAAGVQQLDLSASAAADGDECTINDDACGPGDTTPPTTAQDAWTYCNSLSDEQLMRDSWPYCSEFYPDVDVDQWWADYCVIDGWKEAQHIFGWLWYHGSYNYGGIDIPMGCRTVPGLDSDRSDWADDVCIPPNEALIYSNWNYFEVCREFFPGTYTDDNWDAHNPPSPTTSTTTEPPSPSSSIDLSG